MIYLLYAVVVVAIVFVSTKASKYVDLLEKKTTLSGAFIGGVMLSAVTSLPELFTSISAASFLNQPGLSIGNILGSNLFNLVILAVLSLVFFKSFSECSISVSHQKTTVFGFLLFLAIIFNMLGVLNIELINEAIPIINLTSIVIVIIYILGVRSMSSESSEEESSEDTDDMSLKSVIIRFVIVSLFIIGLSIVLTYLTDMISVELGLGAGLAGALFLGIATSLPELSSTIALFRMKSFNIGVGNVLGSNLFNFVILAVADILYWGDKAVYDFADPKNINLLIFGAIATPLAFIIIKIKNKYIKAISAVGIIACYIAFLLV